MTARMVQSSSLVHDNGAENELSVDPDSEILLQVTEVQQSYFPSVDGMLGRQEDRQQIPRRQARADREYGTPGEPVGPYRHGRNDFAVSDPSSGAMDCGPTGFVRMKASDLR